MKTFIISLVVFSSLIASMVESVVEVKTYVIYTDNPTNEDPKTFHLRMLSSALGSEEAAKEAMLDTYKGTASGFAAKLTDDQLGKISKQPGVTWVDPTGTYKVSSRGGGGGDGGVKVDL